MTMPIYGQKVKASVIFTQKIARDILTVGAKQAQSLDVFKIFFSDNLVGNGLATTIPLLIVH